MKISTPDYADFFRLAFNFMDQLNQIDKYKLEFYVLEFPPPFIERRSLARPKLDSMNMPVGGAMSGFLASILCYYNKVSLVDDLITEITWDMNPDFGINESYNLDEAIYIATYKNNLIFGNHFSRAPHLDPNNYTIPLTDFKELIIEWSVFLKSIGTA